MTSRRATLRSGLGAVAKTAILVVGVPLALWRLWFVSPLPRHLARPTSLGSASLWAHLAVLVVATIWLVAAWSLLREIGGALRRHEPIEATSWSTRWAVAIAALVVLATASSSLVHGPRPSAPRPAATALAPKRAATTKQTTATARTATVGRGECLSDLALRVTGCADDWPAIARANFNASQPDGSRLVDPARLRAGWHLDIPDTLGTFAPAAPPDPAGRLAELALVGMSIVTTCALARRLRVLRRAGIATRRDGARPSNTPTLVGPPAAALMPFADAPLIDWIDVANRLLWRAAAQDPTSVPEIRLVRAGPDGIEFLFAEASPEPPWPFVARNDGRWWQLDQRVELSELAAVADGCGRFVPALVPLGDDALASYLVPVQKGRRLSISGDSSAVDAMIGSIVAALRCVPWGEELAVELVGIEAPPPDEQCYQLASSGLGPLAELDSERLSSGSRLDAPWRREPLVIVARDALSPGDESVLRRAGAVAGIIAAGDRGTEVLELTTDGATLHPYGLVLETPAPSSSQLALVEALFAAARRPPEMTAIRPSVASLAEHLEELPPRGAVELRILRAIPDLVGAFADPFARDAVRVVEFICYLVLHGGQATVDEIAEALFSRSPAASRMPRTENVGAAARAALGGLGSNSRLVRRGRTFVLDASVTCDWLRAERALAAARLSSPEQAERLAASALELLEGAPLSGVVAGYSWMRAESLDETIAAEIVDGAHRLAALALASSDVERARWAIERGRLVDAESEILARDQMTACDAGGDRGGVRAAFSELERALERLGGNEPSVETRALFEALDTES